MQLEDREFNLCDFALFLSVMKNETAHRNILSIIIGEKDLELKEVKDLHLEDGTTKIFLNMSSKNGEPVLVSLLQYMKHTTLENRKLHAIMSGASCGMLAWRGFIAADILEKLRLHIRPYETGAGDTDRAYYACLDRLVEVVEAKGDVERAVIGMVEAMRAVPVDRSRPRPLIGLVGEAYLRNVDYASNNIIQSVEQMGGEIRMPAIMEVLWYSLYKQRYFQELGRHRVKAFIHRVQHGILNRIERKMRRHAASVLPDPYEKPIWEVIGQSGLSLDAGLGFGASVEMARSGISGIIHAIPFNCVPGTVIQGLEGRFRSLFPGIPFMTVGFSGQADLGVRIRLEALVHQCRSLAPGHAARI